MLMKSQISCHTESLSDEAGIKIICNGDSIGYVLNGVNGADGKDGAAGKDGVDGKDGADGKDGVDGVDGVNGLNGVNGKDGADGKDGKDGKDGANGKDGSSESCVALPLDDLSGFKVMCGQDSIGVLLNGEKGDKGDQGEQGLQGEQGEQGIQGEKGETGEKGEKGDQGEQGLQGEQGEKGETGEKGEQGVQGEKGQDGTSCTIAPLADGTGYKVLCGGDSTGVLLNGVKGDQGEQGPQGEQGEKGDPGEKGDQGEKGDKGDPGQPGSSGSNGADGYTPTVTTSTVEASEEHPNGGVMIVVTYKDTEGNIKSDTTYIWNGADGEKGDKGDQGEKGDKGDTGDKGDKGDQGQPGSSGSNGADGYTPTVTTSTVDASEEHPNGGVMIVVTYKDTEGNTKSDTTYVWNGADGEKGDKGDPGEKGEQGEKGDPGKDGQDYTPSSSSVSSSSAESSSSIESSSSSESSSSAASSSSVESSSSVDACAVIRATKDDFVPIEDVLPCVKSNEKIIYVVRHSDRNDGNNYGSYLNNLGIEHAKALGQRLQGTPDFFFMSTGTKRTGQTAYLVGKGKGQTGLDSAAMVGANASSTYYEKTYHDGGYWRPGRTWNKEPCNAGTDKDGVGKYYDEHGVYTYYTYYPDRCTDNFASLTDRINEFLNNYASYDKMHNITFSVSHDQFVIVFLIYFTNKAINMAFHESSVVWDAALPHNEWTNFLSGFAFIVDENNNRTFIPVKGLDSGRYQGTTVLP